MSIARLPSKASNGFVSDRLDACVIHFVAIVAWAAAVYMLPVAFVAFSVAVLASVRLYIPIAVGPKLVAVIIIMTNFAFWF